MEIRKNFGRYWIAGFILSLILFAIQIVGGLILNKVILNQELILNNLALVLILFISSVLLFIFGFWIYGLIIELLYKKIIQKT